MAERPWNPREAYYEAVMDMGIARDTLQIAIGVCLASMADVRKVLRERAPTRIQEFDALVMLTTDHLGNDLCGEEGGGTRAT